MDLKVLIGNVINTFKSEETYLLNHNLCERCLMFRFAYYLQQEINRHPNLSGFFVDCEFNKNGFDGNEYSSKTLQFENGDIKEVYIDLIVHRRSSNIEDNLLCIEFKKNASIADQTYDINRIKQLTTSNPYGDNIYNYNCGFYIDFSNIDNYTTIVDGIIII